MICEKCNKNIDDDSKFCSFCGNKIEKKVEEVYIDKLKQNISDEIELSKNEELKDSGEDEKNLKSMGFYDFYFNYKGSIGRKEFFFRGFLPLTIIELLLSISIFITVNLSVYNSFYNILKYEDEKKYKYKLITYDETSLSEDIEVIKYEDFVFEFEDIKRMN